GPVVPRYDGALYTEKPPVAFWGMVACSLPAGQVTSFSARLAGVLFGIGILLFVFAIGRRLWDARTGMLAALVLLSFPQFLAHMTLARLDMPLAFFMTGAILAGLRRIQDPGAGMSSALALGACLGFGILVKGPVAIALPLGTLALWRIGAGDFHSLRRLFPPAGALAALAIPAAWGLLALAQLGSAEWKAYMEAILGRAARGAQNYPRPATYYLQEIGRYALPFLIFLPAALSGWVARRTDRSDPSLLPLVWFAAQFLAFSAVSGKRGGYLLPALPGLALLIAGALSPASRLPEAAARWLRDFPLRAFGLALFAAGPCIAFWVFWNAEGGALHPAGFPLGGIAAAAIAAVPLAAVAIRRRIAAVGPVAAAPMIALAAASLLSLSVAADRAKSIGHETDRGLSALADAAPPGRPLWIYTRFDREKERVRFDPTALRFHLRRPLRAFRTLDDLDGSLRKLPAAGPGARAPVVFADLPGWREIRKRLGRGARILRGAPSSDGYVFALETAPGE
ncbi:MAG: glycosyltransferase family 39 protein, partial [Planctomycetota bacterium]